MSKPRIAGQPGIFEQGARCGHIEGKGGKLRLARTLAAEAGANQRLRRVSDIYAWCEGYLHGYTFACANKPLPSDIADAPLPSPDCFHPAEQS